MSCLRLGTEKRNPFGDYWSPLDTQTTHSKRSEFTHQNVEDLPKPIFER